MRYSGILILCTMLAFPAVAATTENDALRAHYGELMQNPASNPFGMPLSVQSSEQDNKVSAEIYAVLEQPFAVVAETLSDVHRWCGFLLLSVNVKSCSVGKDASGTLLTLYLGPKDYQTPKQAYEMRYQFRNTGDAQRSETFLDADAGPLGTRDNHIHLEAIGVEDRTLIHFTSGMRLGTMSRMASSTYLATLGRSKIGFSSVPGPGGKRVPVKGVKAMIERNAVRYFLALQVYLDTRALPDTERFEQQILRWFQLSERFHAQLYELPQADYLTNKRRERDNQIELQRRVDNGKPRF